LPYRYFEGITTADVAFEASGATLEEVFRMSAEAVLHVMLSNPDALRPEVRKSIFIELGVVDAALRPIEAAQSLLHDFLEKLLYFKDAENLLLRASEIKFRQDSRGRLDALEAVCLGEVMDPSRHFLETDVKAITHHHFGIAQTAEGWTARVVIDV